MKFLIFIFVATFSVNASGMSTPPSTASASRESFSSPDRRAMAEAIKQSPARPRKRATEEAAIVTAETIDGELISAPKELISELLQIQKRPFVIICAFSTRSAALRPPSLPGVDEEITHIILTPTHDSDYGKLVDINSVYQESVKKAEGDESFLSRNYGVPSEFHYKISHLYSMYSSLGVNSLHPLFYVMPEGFYDSESGTQRDPDFMSSITFSILGIVRKFDGSANIEVLGDIWLSHIDDSESVCLSGTSERSTMVDSKRHSMGIGQTAVSAFNKYVVANWYGKETYLIRRESAAPEKSNLFFDGIVAYVEPSNFKSIGNNFRSHNFLIGAVNIQGKTESENKPMLMFRAPSRVCSPEHLAVDALKQLDASPGPSLSYSADSHDVKKNLFVLWDLVKSLYPSSRAIEQGDWVEIPGSLVYGKSPLYEKKLGIVNQIITEFHGFSPEYSEREIAGSPHFRRLTKSPVTE